jgi:hypothetical protein
MDTQLSKDQLAAKCCFISDLPPNCFGACFFFCIDSIFKERALIFTALTFGFLFDLKLKANVEKLRLSQ